MIRIDQRRLVRWPLVQGPATPGVSDLLSLATGPALHDGAPQADPGQDLTRPDAARVVPTAPAGREATVTAATGADPPEQPSEAAAPLPPEVYLPRLRAPLQIVSFGGFAVSQAGAHLGAGVLRPKARLLLAALLCARGPIHRHALLRWLWDHLPASRAAHALRTTVYELRRAVEPPAGRGRGPSLIAVDDQTYRVALREDDEWDVVTFLRLAEEAKAARGEEERMTLLAAAEERSRGELLPEWPDAGWARALRAEVEEARRDVLAASAEALARAGRLGEAAKRYRELVAREPACEEWHRALMRLYIRLDERGLALLEYRACRDALAALDAEPSPSTALLAAELSRSRAGAVDALAAPAPAVVPGGSG